MVIYNKKEFENFYPYDKKYINEYPKEYPCVVKQECVNLGIMGDEKRIYVAYFPKNLSVQEAFIFGLNYNWKVIK